jgi:hypothetical protein
MINTLLGLIANPVPVPEAGTTVALLGFALVMLIFLHRKSSRAKLQPVSHKNLSGTILVIAGLFAFISSANAGPVQPPATVPESGQTFILLAIALISLVVWRQRTAKKS